MKPSWRLLGAAVGGYAAWRSWGRRPKGQQLVLQLDLADVKDSVHSRDRALTLGSDGHRAPADRCCSARLLAVDEVAAAVRTAAADPLVTGLVANFSEVGAALSLADAQELRDAVRHFRTSKAEGEGGAEPFTCAFAHEFGARSLDYYAAASFGRVLQMPLATLEVPTMCATLLSLRGLLSSWGVHFDTIASREQHGGGVLSRQRCSAENLRSTSRLLRSSYEQVIAGVAKDRGMSERALQRLAARGALSSKDAVAARLIDGCVYPDEVDALIDDKCPQASRLSVFAYHHEKKAARDWLWLQQRTFELFTRGIRHALHSVATGREAVLSALARSSAEDDTLDTTSPEATDSTPPPLLGAKRWSQYAEAAFLLPMRLVHMATSGAPLDEESPADVEATPSASFRSTSWWATPPRRAVAVVSACGTISRHPDSTGGSCICPETICAQLRAARKDERICAVVLRIDTSGGDALASELICREIKWLRQSGRPVVVSMGSYCAGAGVFIAAAATKVVAQPGSITGACGAQVDCMDASGLLRMQRVNLSQVSFGGEPRNPFRPMSAARREALLRQAQNTHAVLVDMLANSRGISSRRARSFSNGRAWTGKQAHSRKVVDGLGGLEFALEVACKEAQVDQEWRQGMLQCLNVSQSGAANHGLQWPNVADLFNQEIGFKLFYSAGAAMARGAMQALREYATSALESENSSSVQLSLPIDARLYG
ncbi:hypothetical protein AB1Y20_006065 [Prymnesium parvum]|uniref:Peptidase S49 domain-containing protein n=1 Tax=Prymnesium parvum TaxID=97485 RepID=A0AB34J2W3_PRYPA